jgi:poly(beta-D-mannuronate) lyase
VRVAEHQLGQLPRDGSPTDTALTNNHAYWRGLMATGVGVIARDDHLFRFGLRSFRHAVGALDDNGAWPLEMARHERALHYQSFALQPLILIAELAARQGVDLYATQEGGRSIHDAVRFLLGALEDPRAIARYTAEPQYLGSLKPGSGDHAWAEFYARRYPYSGAGKLLTAPLFSRWLGGGATVYAAPVR